MSAARAELGTLVRYALIGGSFSLFYAVATAGIINVTRFDPFAVSVVVFALCIPPAFYAQQHLAFRAERLRKHAFAMYAATQIGSLVVVSAITTRFVTYDMVYDTVIMGLTVGTAAVISFLIGRFVVFRPEG